MCCIMLAFDTEKIRSMRDDQYQPSPCLIGCLTVLPIILQAAGTNNMQFMAGRVVCWADSPVSFWAFEVDKEVGFCLRQPGSTATAIL